MQRRDQIREFVSRYFRGYALKDGEDMFSTGFVNSMFAMQLVTFVERELGVVVEAEDMELDNFRSVDAIDAFVARKQGAAA